MAGDPCEGSEEGCSDQIPDQQLQGQGLQGQSRGRVKRPHAEAREGDHSRSAGVFAVSGKRGPGLYAHVLKRSN